MFYFSKGKTAIVLPGDFQAFRIGLPSLLEKVIDPIDADVFVFGSRRYHMHTFVEGVQTYSEFCVTEEDEAYIRKMLGSHLRYFVYAEDVVDYDKIVCDVSTSFVHRLSWFCPGGREVAYFDPVVNRVRDQRRYFDQWIRLNLLLSLLKRKYNQVYDVWVRGRIDFSWEKGITSIFRGVMEEFVWVTLDSFFCGPPYVMEKVGHFVDYIGEFDTTDDFAANFDVYDYRLGPEPQFRSFISSLHLDSRVLPIFARVRVYRPDGKGGTLCTKPINWMETEASRSKQKCSFVDFYEWEHCSVLWVWEDPRLQGIIAYCWQ